MKNYKFQTQTLQEKLIHTMIATLAILATVYCLVLLSLVFDVIEQKQNNITIKDLSSKISYLESSYANEIAAIDDHLLNENNFKHIDGSFAVRKDPIASFALLYGR